MKLRKIMIVVLVAMTVVSTAFAASSRKPTRKPVRRGSSMFQKGDKLFTPEFLLIYRTACLGGNFELFLKRNISVGGDLVGTLNSPTVMIFSPDVVYHFDVKVKNLDVFAGAGPALAFAVRGHSGSQIGFKPFGGARYNLTPKIVGYFKVLAFISGASSFGAGVGVTFRL